MTELAIMIEGQDGLNWPRWKRLIQAAEDFGFQGLFRSDHFTNPVGNDKDSLELWVSLTYLAANSSRIEFGPLVTPVMFRRPQFTARYAAHVDDLSDGRLILGMGAGWQEREHRKFGIPFMDFPARYDRLEEALDIVTLLLNSDDPVTYIGDYYSLEDATLLPRPQRPGGPPILIGGHGPTRTLPLVVKYATEWNCITDPVTYKARAELLDQLLDEAGRERTSVRRSLMMTTIFEESDQLLRERLAADGESFDELVANGRIVGTASQVIDQIGAWAELGVERFMLQWLDQDDIDGLEAFARDVLPHFHT